MSKRWKKWSIVAGMAVVAAAVLFAGGIVGGILSGVIPVGAQEPPVEGRPFGIWHHGRMGRGWGGHGAALDTAAEVLGMTPEELRAELQAGKSLAEVAEEQGVDPQAICDAAHAQREETLQQAVADGRLTQEQADSILERMAEHEGDCLSAPGRPFGMRHGRSMGLGWGGHGAGLDTAAEVLGMTPEELRAELQAGKSLAEVADEQGVDPQAICDAAHAQREETLQQAVADGRLTREQADSILERMAEHEGDCLSMTGNPLGFGRAGEGRWGRFGHALGAHPFGHDGQGHAGRPGCPMDSPPEL
jgi:hypothetical protein